MFHKETLFATQMSEISYDLSDKGIVGTAVFRHMIHTAILLAITEKGSLTRDEYNVIYARTLQEWQQKQARPNN